MEEELFSRVKLLSSWFMEIWHLELKSTWQIHNFQSTSSISAKVTEALEDLQQELSQESEITTLEAEGESGLSYGSWCLMAMTPECGFQWVWELPASSRSSIQMFKPKSDYLLIFLCRRRAELRNSWTVTEHSSYRRRNKDTELG